MPLHGAPPSLRSVSLRSSSRPLLPASPQTHPTLLPRSTSQFLPLVSRAPLSTAIDLIEAALAQGKIDDVTALVYKVYAVFGDPRLPAEYRGPNKAIRSGTEVMSEAQGRYDALPADIQALLLPFLIPPYYQGSWDDQQPAQGPAVAAAPLTLPPGAALAPDGPPGHAALRQVVLHRQREIQGVGP